MDLRNPTSHISVLSYSTNKNFTSSVLINLYYILKTVIVRNIYICIRFSFSFSLFKKGTKEIVTLVRVLALKVISNYRRFAFTYIIWSLLVFQFELIRYNRL